MSGSTVLIIYIVLLVPLMLLGFYFARRKMFTPHHKLTMTGVLLLNWLLILAVMIGSYSSGVAPNIPDKIGEIGNLLPTVHLVVGTIAQLMATYLVILMWTENTSVEGLVPFRIKNIKTPMRITLSLWLLTVVLGFGIYAVWYGGGDDSGDAPTPAVTEEVTAPDENTPEVMVTEEATPEPIATEEATEEVASTPEVVVTEEATEAVEPTPEVVATEEATEEAPEVSATEEAPEVSTTEEADAAPDVATTEEADG